MAAITLQSEPAPAGDRGLSRSHVRGHGPLLSRHKAITFFELDRLG